MENLYIKDKYDHKKYIDARKDIIIVNGGDGTLLKAINKFKYLKKPFFGIAAGTENFLMNTNKEISKKSKYKKFNLIKAKITFISYNIQGNEIEKEIELQAFNEICIGGDMHSWINFDVKDKDKIIGKFKGGGIIISTAQGSTGINKNNNGVILPLSSSNWSITGDKTNRKINYVIKAKKTLIYTNSRTDVSVWIDGSNHIINKVKKVELSKGEKISLIFNNYTKFKKKREI